MESAIDKSSILRDLLRGADDPCNGVNLHRGIIECDIRLPSCFRDVHRSVVCVLHAHGTLQVKCQAILMHLLIEGILHYEVRISLWTKIGVLSKLYSADFTTSSNSD